MKKKLSALLLIFVIIALFLTLVACDTTALSFSSESYTVQVGTSFTPGVSVKPKNNSYVISSGNSTIATVKDNVVTAVKEGVVTLTVSSGNVESRATLYCVKDTVVNPTDITVVTTYTVSFEIVNYEEMGLETGYIEGVYAYEGSTIDVNVPMMTGYLLEGWYVDRACTENYDMTSKVYSSFTLYAHATELEMDFAVSNNLVTGLMYPNLMHEELVLPSAKNGSPIYGIADEAFIGDTQIKRVVLPETYRTIGTSAFAGCENLEEVVVPDGCNLTTIGANAFGVLRDENDRITSGCEKLASMRLPDTITRVGSFAFYNCAELVLSGIPAGLTEIEQYAFSGTKINNVSFRNVLAVSEGAFYNCKQLDTVTNTSSVARCAKKVFNGTKLETDAQTQYSGSLNSQKDDYAAYYADTILFGCYRFYGTAGGSGKLRVKSFATLIADEAFAGSYQSELTLYLDTEIANAATNRDFIGKNVFVDSVGVFLVVPEDLVESYKARYSAENEGRDYAEKVVSEEIVTVHGNADTINLGEHHLLKKTVSGGAEYFYDKYVSVEEGTASHINLGQLGLLYDVVRINMNAICNVETLRILNVGRVKSIAYYAIADCGKTTEIKIIDGVETPTQKNIFTKIEFTDTVNPTILEHKISIRFDSMPDLYAYVKSADLTAYRAAWGGDKFQNARSRLVGM